MAKLKGSTTIGGQMPWHTGNMGTGSGLDADTLDGLHANEIAGGTDYSSGGTMTGDLTVTGVVSGASFNTTSLRKMKEEIKAYKESAISILEAVEVVSFKYINKPEPRVGFIADDTNPILSGVNQDCFDIANVAGVLIKAVQELNERIAKIERALEDGK